MFVTRKNDDKSKTPKDIEKVVCFKCHTLRHYAQDCPEKKGNIVAATNYEERKTDGEKDKIVATVSTNVGIVQRSKLKRYNAFMLLAYR